MHRRLIHRVVAAVVLLFPPCAVVSSFQAPSSSLHTRRTRTMKVCMSLSPEQLKDDLVALAASTRRGFVASRKDRDRAKRIIHELSKLSPTDEPAAAYYTNNAQATSEDGPSLAGKWTLLYTDAPDITSLDSPVSIQKLGRIGQECNPPLIKNVIEWKRPDWASSFPFSGDDNSRILQKVVTEGSSSPADNPTVDLKLVGFEISGTNDNGSIGSDTMNGPAAFFEQNPIKLQGPLKGPFGKFDILYLDDDMRITKTYQGYYAVNIREEEWF